jgi:hypothetical protein
MTIWRMRIACWITRATYSLILNRFSTSTVVARIYFNILQYHFTLNIASPVKCADKLYDLLRDLRFSQRFQSFWDVTVCCWSCSPWRFDWSDCLHHQFGLIDPEDKRRTILNETSVTTPSPKKTQHHFRSVSLLKLSLKEFYDIC